MTSTAFTPTPALPLKRGGRSAPINASVARAERARRELARRRLKAFMEYALPWWKPAKVHELVCAALEEVFAFIESGGQVGVGSLIIEMVPQHGKTTTVSQGFPAWLLGKLPDKHVMLTAYGADLATENSRKVRDILMSERFAAVFGQQSTLDAPVEISIDNAAKANWSLSEPHRGGVVAAGVGGGTTGKTADLIVIDDPIKNREEAESPEERKKVLRWMTSSILSRARKGTAIVIIHTRWHREDLIGEMLKSTVTDVKARPWKIISLPAFPLEVGEYALNLDQVLEARLQGLHKPYADPLGREPGSKIPLWEAEFPVETLEQIRSTLEATGQVSDWWSLYMQQPRPAEGAFFGTGDFEIVERAPEYDLPPDPLPKGKGSEEPSPSPLPGGEGKPLRKMRWYRYVDLAISEKRSADFNATVAEGMDAQGNVYLRDMIRVQGWNEFKEMLIAAMTSAEEKGTVWALEDVAFQALAFQELLRDPRLANVDIRSIKPENDKVTRARPLQARGKAGKLKLVRGPWNQAFLMEALDFPNGRHDDQIDTASGGLEMIAKGAYGKVGIAFAG